MRRHPPEQPARALRAAPRGWPTRFPATITGPTGDQTNAPVAALPKRAETRPQAQKMATTKTLRLSHDKGLLCGVCGGLAEWLGWKPWVVRILYVLLSLGTAAFPGMLVYAILYLTLPEPERAQRTSRHEPAAG
jgi:phage shock protein C